MNYFKTSKKHFQIDIRKKTDAEGLIKLDEQRLHYLRQVGNLLHPSVVVHNNEDFNEIARTFGDIETRKRYSHVDLIHMIGGADLERGSNVAGSRGYFLTGPGVHLNLALIHYSTSLLAERDFTLLQTPFFMKKEAMNQVTR